ncbi:MAG: protein kinase [Polyangiaceae bacterium]|nr:protein kinase [Polyangiaceae bacterium]
MEQTRRVFWFCRDWVHVKETEQPRIIAKRYELVKLLGQGGMGEVWVANDRATGARVALKVLKLDAATSKEHRARFEREARIASSLISPHITRVTDAGIDENDTPYMALELLEGDDLQKRIKTEKVLPLQYVVRLAIQVGRALHVAHTAGLVHRDLKPANIFLARQGNDEIAKVLDFGIAKGGSLESTEYTTAGAMLGTASYMSPEQIRNAKTVDHRADLWALAVVLFRALTGNFPFPETGFELFLALTQDPIPTPIKATSLVPTLPAPLNVFFERSFLKDISQRYPNASAMIVGFCRAAGVTVPPDILEAASVAVPAPISTSVPQSGQPTSSPQSGQPVSGPHSGQPVSGPHSGQPMSGQPSSGVHPAPVHHEPIGLSGTLMLDVAPDPMPPMARSGSVPAAGRSGEIPLLDAELDPDEPDNAATLFYHPGASAPVAIQRDLPLPPGPPPPPAHSVELPENLPAIAPEQFGSRHQPTMPSNSLGEVSRAAQEEAARARPRGAPGARVGLWIGLMVGLLVVLGVVAAVFLMKPE